MEYVLSFVVLVGVLVWVHELGHFLFAKLFGVKVETFSIGFGPAILKKKLGETEYRLSAVPLGGYVKMYGEEEGISDPRSFSSKPNWQKILIAFAGPLFNFIFAIALFSMLFNLPRQVPTYIDEKVIVGHVLTNSPADRLGIKAGDVVVEVNGKRVNSWKDLERSISESVLKKEWTVKVSRDGKEETLSGEVSITRSVGFGIQPNIKPVIGFVLPSTPAHQVGLKKGDLIVAINGKAINNWYEAVEEIRRSGEKPINLRILREQKPLEITVVPQLDKKSGLPILGVSPYIETKEVRLSLVESIEKGFEKTYDISILSLKALWALITGSISFNTLGGPIAIAQLAGESAQQGLITFLGIMAFISIQLAIFNLIPLPVLDGGLILLFLMEYIRGRKLSPKFKETWQKVGFAIIIALSGLVIINDLIRLITGKSL